MARREGQGDCGPAPKRKELTRARNVVAPGIVGTVAENDALRPDMMDGLTNAMPRATVLPLASSASAVTYTSTASRRLSLNTVPLIRVCPGLLRSAVCVTRKPSCALATAARTTTSARPTASDRRRLTTVVPRPALRGTDPR